MTTTRGPRRSRVVLAGALGLLAACTITPSPGAGSGTGAAAPTGPGGLPTRLPTTAPTGLAGSTPASSAPTTTASPTPQPSCASTVLAGLTDAEVVGQLVMAAVPATSPADGVELVTRYRLGGVFLAGRSSAPADDVAAGVAALQDAARAGAGIALDVAVDQEGGLVRTLQGPGVVQLPSAVEQARWSSDTLRRRTSDLAASLAAAGVTTDLAPVADVVPAGTAGRNPSIGAVDRQYGSTPDDVARAVSVVATALRDNGIQPVVKHFPGLGRTRADTDRSTRAVDRVTTADDPALQPFRAAVDAGAAGVMVSLAVYPRLDPDAPAVFSRTIVTDLLRGGLGWDGVVVSDDLGNAVAVQSVPVGQRAVRFVAAGGDVVLTAAAEAVPAMVDALLARATSDPGFASAVRRSTLRVLAAKAAAGRLTCP